MIRKAASVLRRVLSGKQHQLSDSEIQKKVEKKELEIEAKRRTGRAIDPTW